MNSQMAYSSAITHLESSTWRTLPDLTRSPQGNIMMTVSGAGNVYDDVNSVLWKVVPPGLLAFGTFGNIMTVIVMRGMQNSKSTASLSVYFTALAVSDQCVLTTSLIFYWFDMGFSWPPSFFRFHLLCIVPKFTWNAGDVTAAWILVAMTYQRVTSVVAPHRVGVLCAVRRGKFIIAAIAVISCSMNLHFLFSWSYWSEYGECQYRKKYMPYLDLFEWLDLIFASMLPFLFLTIGNSILICHVIKALRVSQTMMGNIEQQTKSGTDKVLSMSMTLILTSAAFLVLTIPSCMFDVCLQMDYIKFSDDDFSAMINLVYSFVLIMGVANSAVNFYIYLLTGSKLRQETKRYLCCRGTDTVG